MMGYQAYLFDDIHEYMIKDVISLWNIIQLLNDIPYLIISLINIK